MKKDNCSYRILIYSIVTMLLTTIVHFYGQYLYDDYLLEEKNKKLLQLSKVNYINKQLDEFYIPLSIQLDRSKRLFLDFKTKYKDKNSILDINQNSSLLERAEWRIYLLSVFKSTHIRMEDLVISKRYLSGDNNELNDKLNVLIQHINQYKVIFKKWGDGNTSEDISPVHFPDTLNDLVKMDIKNLQLQKDKLLKT